MQQGKRVTLATIAEAAGVSQMTVSMALRNHPRISAATRVRVREHAARLGYRPDPILSRLMTHLRTAAATTRPTTIAYLLSRGYGTDWEKTYLGRMFEGARKRAEALGYTLDVLSIEQPGMTARRMRKILHSRGIEGILVAPLRVGGGHLSLDLAHFAVAHVGASLWRPALHSARHDYFHGMMLIMRNLVRHDYRRIGLVTNTQLTRTTEHQEEAAFLYYASRLRQKPTPILVLRDWESQSFLEWFRRHRPDAIATAYPAVIPALKDAGCRVPEDVGVALNWIPPGEIYTGVRQNFEATGSTAFDLVESQLRRHECGVPTEPKAVLIRGHWVEGPYLRQVPR